MPNRIIKESICYSESIKGLSWFEEVLFYRLIVNADDYGRLDGRLEMLQARLFPLRRDITENAIKKTLNVLTTAGMVQKYECDGRPFLQLTAWEKHQQVRAKKSKFPQPPSIEINGNQLNSNAPVIQSESESESESSRKICKDVISYLNNKLGKRYTLTETYFGHMNARINEGAGIDDFKKVIDIKSAKWNKEPERGEKDMRQYLRPETLFGTKFQSYLNETDTTKPKEPERRIL